MDQRQINHLSMYGSVVTNFNQNAAVYSSNTIFTTAVNNFKTAVTGLSALQTGQINHSSGITVTKEQAKESLIQLTIDHATAGRAYAAILGNAALKQDLKVSATELERLQDAQLAPACQDIYNQIVPIIGSLTGYGVTAATLLSLQSAIGTFMPLVGQPKNARSTAKAFTIAIAQQIKNIQLILEEQLDPLMRQYKITHQTFHDTYLSDRKVSSHHKRTTVTAKVRVTNAQNQPVKKAHVKLLNTTRKIKITKDDGKSMFARMHPGIIAIEVSAKGYVTQTKTVTQSTPGNVTINISLSTGTNTGGGTNTNTTTGSNQ